MDAAQLGSGVLWVDAAAAEALTVGVGAAGWRTAACSLIPDMDKPRCIAAIAESLDFPDWTGRNLDALYDSLTDLSWVDETQVLLVLNGSASLDVALSSWQQIRGVLLEAAEWWHSHDRTLIVAITSPS